MTRHECSCSEASAPFAEYAVLDVLVLPADGWRLTRRTLRTTERAPLARRKRGTRREDTVAPLYPELTAERVSVRGTVPI